VIEPWFPVSGTHKLVLRLDWLYPEPDTLPPGTMALSTHVVDSCYGT